MFKIITLSGREKNYESNGIKNSFWQKLSYDSYKLSRRCHVMLSNVMLKCKCSVMYCVVLYCK